MLIHHFAVISTSFLSPYSCKPSVMFFFLRVKCVPKGCVEPGIYQAKLPLPSFPLRKCCILVLHWVWKGRIDISKICLCLFVIITALYGTQCVIFN